MLRSHWLQTSLTKIRTENGRLTPNGIISCVGAMLLSMQISMLPKDLGFMLRVLFAQGHGMARMVARSMLPRLWQPTFSLRARRRTALLRQTPHLRDLSQHLFHQWETMTIVTFPSDVIDNQLVMFNEPSFGEALLLIP